MSSCVSAYPSLAKFMSCVSYICASLFAKIAQQMFPLRLHHDHYELAGSWHGEYSLQILPFKIVKFKRFAFSFPTFENLRSVYSLQTWATPCLDRRPWAWHWLGSWNWWVNQTFDQTFFKRIRSIYWTFQSFQWRLPLSLPSCGSPSLGSSFCTGCSSSPSSYTSNSPSSPSSSQSSPSSSWSLPRYFQKECEGAE